MTWWSDTSAEERGTLMQAVRRYRTLPYSSPTGQIARAIFKLRKNPEVAEMLKQKLKGGD